jgi:DHA1 family bicyclomycin/chloramphenicol resistance-like MFS transporter
MTALPTPAQTFTPARRFELILLFGVLTVFTPIGIDMYLPALPAIAREFRSPIAAIEHSLAAFFLGLCLGQAAVGPISDRFGRRMPIIIGLGLYVVGATACALATGPLTLDAARFVQALGGCAGTVLARACVRDLFPPKDAARIFAQMLLILSVSPLFAPFLGGWLLPVVGWRGIFWVQVATAIVTLLVVVSQLPESHPGSDRRLHPLHVLKDYWIIARDPRFYRYIVPAVITGGGLYVFLTGWPHVVINLFGVAPRYFGFTFVMNGVGLIAFSQGTARWLKHRAAEPLLFAAIVVGAVLGVGSLLFGITGWGGVLGLVPFMFCYCAMLGCINPTSAGLTMQHFGHAAGMTSALIGILLYGTGTLASLAMGAFPNPATPIPMTGLICGFGVTGLVTYLLFRPRAAG